MEETDWIVEEVQGLTTYVETMDRVVLRHPQTAYAGMKNSLH